MPYKNNLPEYPCKEDIWEKLKKEKRPIVVYGMGNGADKLIKRLDGYGVKISDFFASDGFVRGHTFHGMRVKSFSEIRESYDDFVILLSFASNREEVIEMLAEIDENYDMLVPDMPVADEGEYFDREFFNYNYQKIVKAYETLDDEDSRKCFAAVVNYKLSGRMKFLLDAYSQRDDIYSLVNGKAIKIAIDAGAYNGDTVREAKSFVSTLEKVYAVEPDNRNFKKLLKYSEAECEISVVPINAAAWCETTDGQFFGSGNRNSSVNSTASFEHRESAVSLVRLDEITDEKIDYIKFDVEGAESEALIGSERIIERNRPTILVSLYHRSRDIFDIINTLKSKYPDYKFYLRRLKCLPAWELDLIMIPTSQT